MSHIDLQESTGGASSSHHTATYISMGSSNFISAAVLDISRKATAVKERADFIGILYSCTQNLLLSSCKFYCTNSGCGKEMHIYWSMVTCQGSTRSELP